MAASVRSQLGEVVLSCKAARKTLLLLSLAALYAVSRLGNLGLLPIFLDEGEQIQWSLNIWRAHGMEFVAASVRPLQDGRLLHILLMSLVSPWAPDALLGCRLLSALAGAVTAWSCYRIGDRLYDGTVGLFSAVLYLICPFAMFCDRLALSDSFLCAGSALTLWATIAFIEDGSWRHWRIQTLCLGLTPLVKITGVVLFALPLVVWLALRGPHTDAARLCRRLALAYAVAMSCIGAAYCLSYLFGSHELLPEIIRLATFSQQHSVGSYASARWETAMESAGWISAYLTPPVVIVFLAGLLLALFGRDRKALLLGSVALILCGSIVLLSTLVLPRYFVWISVPCAVLTAATLMRFGEAIAGRWKLEQAVTPAIAFLFLICVSLPAIRFDHQLLTNVSGAPLPAVDMHQYVDAWPSGYGVAEAAVLLKAATALAPGKVLVVCPEIGGNSRFGLRILLDRERTIRVIYRRVRGDAVFAQLRRWAANRVVYLVFEQPSLSSKLEEQPDIEGIEKIAQRTAVYLKPGGKSAIHVYRVNAR